MIEEIKPIAIDDSEFENREKYMLTKILAFLVSEHSDPMNRIPDSNVECPFYKVETVKILMEVKQLILEKIGFENGKFQY